MNPADRSSAGADQTSRSRRARRRRQAQPGLTYRFAAGDPHAVREMYTRYAGPIFTVVVSRLADRRLAEEAVQEVFLKAWRAAGRFDPTRDLGPWLYEIARNTAADMARRQQRRPVTTTLPAGVAAADLPDLGDAWERWEVRCALRGLAGDERELLRLVHYVGLSQSEIADRLGVPLGTVKARVHRAHRRLAGRLAHLRAVP